MFCLESRAIAKLFCCGKTLPLVTKLEKPNLDSCLNFCSEVRDKCKN